MEDAPADDDQGHLASLRLSRVGAMLAVLVALAGGVSVLLLAPPEQWAAGLLLALALAWASAVDLDRFILPDAITLGLVVAGLGLNAANGDPQAMIDAAAGAAAGYGVLALAAFAYRRLRGRDGLGLGDAKLLAAAGAWLGWAALPMVLLGASATALAWALAILLVRGKAAASQPLPFGPFISLAFFVSWLFPA